MEDARHDLLTRVYLRHYAFLHRVYPRQSAQATYHFATLGISGLVSFTLVALTAAFSLAVSLILQRPVVPWALPDWALIAGVAGTVFLPGFVIDAKFRNVVEVNREVLEFYSSESKRMRWWLMVLSIPALGAITAACFGILRAWSDA